MSSWFGQSRLKKGKSFLVLRVGKEEVYFLFFQKQVDGIHVLSYGSEGIAHFSVRQVLEKIFAQLPYGHSIEELVVTFNASQFQARVIRQTLPKHAPLFVMNKAEVKSIEQEACARAVRTCQKSLLKESGILPNEFSIRRVNILERKIDGYSVSQLEGYKKGEIEFVILAMFLLESPFLALEEFAKEHKILSKLRVIHAVEAIESFAKKHNQSGIFIFMEEEKTQIAVLNGDNFAFLGSIPMGSENFTALFTDAFGMRESAAGHFQDQYFYGDLSLAVQEKVQSYLLPEIRKFVTLVQRKLLETKMVLPDSIKIFGDARALRDWQHLFFQGVFKDLPFFQKPKVDFLLPNDVWEVKKFVGVHDPQYTILCLLGALALES